MKIKFEIEVNVPNTIYCGNCIHQRKDGRIAYCDIFRYGLLEAKDRPQFIKCEKCLLQVRRQA